MKLSLSPDIRMIMKEDMRLILSGWRISASRRRLTALPFQTC